MASNPPFSPAKVHLVDPGLIQIPDCLFSFHSGEHFVYKQMSEHNVSWSIAGVGHLLYFLVFHAQMGLQNSEYFILFNCRSCRVLYHRLYLSRIPNKTFFLNHLGHWIWNYLDFLNLRQLLILLFYKQIWVDLELCKDSLNQSFWYLEFDGCFSVG